MGTETTFAGLIANPMSEKVFLCEVKPGELLVSDAFTSWVDGFLSIYPPAYSSTYVKATTSLDDDHAPDDAVNPANLLTGITTNRTWVSAFFAVTNQAFHIKLSEAAAIGRIYYENFHTLGAHTDIGAKNFTFWGSNTEADFLDTVYANDGTWVNITADLSASQFDQHAASDAADPKYITSSNVTNYLYYRFKIADNWGDGGNMGLRRIELQATVTAAYKLDYPDETITLADSSTEIIKKTIASVEVDGVALTAGTSILNVEATESSYWQDSTNSMFYIHVPGSGDPKDNTIIVYFWVYFATKGIVLNSKYYEPYIAENGIPAISQESQSIHWGASQISSGSVVLLNGRGYFDQIAKLWIWNNKDIKILLGGDSLAYSEYTSIFAGRIMQTRFTKTEFTLEIESRAFALLRLLPINNFWTTTWANLEPSAEGKPIPYYWGSYSAAQAPIVTCINTAYGANVYQFKICDTAFHAIKSITQVYVDYKAGAGWQTIAHSNEDLANATFTISSASFVVGTSMVKVAFEGYHSASVLIEGAPEIAEDILLNQCGYARGTFEDRGSGGVYYFDGSTWSQITNEDPTMITWQGDICYGVFTGSSLGVWRWDVSWAKLSDWEADDIVISGGLFYAHFSDQGADSGVWRWDSGTTWTFFGEIAMPPSDPLDGDLNATSFTDSKAISECALNVAIERETSALNVIETICQSDLAFFDEDGSGDLRYRTWEPVVESSVPVLAKEDILEPPEIEEDTSQLFWKTKVGYSRLHETGEFLFTEASNAESKYKYGRDDNLTIETYLRSKADADQLAGRLNWITRNPSPIISLLLKAGQIDKTLGDKIKVTLARAPLATAGGYVERAFEIISKEISCFPLFVLLKARDTAQFGLNVGFWMSDTAPDWATATAAEKEVSGFWADDDGYIDSTETESKNKSLWW